MSRAVETCSGSCRPVGLQKWVDAIPSAAAFWFINSTKASSEPLTSRASASQHSAPEGRSAPYNRSRTVAVSPGRKPAIEAFSVCKAGKMSSGSVTGVSKSGFASRTSSAVITLVMDAG